MAKAIIFLVFSGIIFLLIKGIMKARNNPESKLRIFEHPATFKKPATEMVSDNTKKKSEPGKTSNRSSLSDNFRAF